MAENFNLANAASDDAEAAALEIESDNWREYGEWLERQEAAFDADECDECDLAHVGNGHDDDCDCDQCVFGDDESTDYGYFDDDVDEYSEYDEYVEAYDDYFYDE